MKINQYEFLRKGKPFEPTKQEIIQFVEYELALKDHRIAVLERALELACEDLQFFDYGEESTQKGIKIKLDYFIEQAEKELEENK